MLMDSDLKDIQTSFRSALDLSVIILIAPLKT